MTAFFSCTNHGGYVRYFFACHHKMRLWQITCSEAAPRSTPLVSCDHLSPLLYSGFYRSLGSPQSDLLFKPTGVAKQLEDNNRQGSAVCFCRCFNSSLSLQFYLFDTCFVNVTYLTLVLSCRVEADVHFVR